MTLSRRKFLGTAFGAGATGLMANAAAASTAAGSPDLLVLENDHALVAIDRETGCVDRLESKDQAWKMRGAGMRLHVPAPEHRFHYLTEHSTAKPRIESDGAHATITWSGFDSPRMGKLDIEVTETVRLEGAGVHFSYEVRNGSQATIESYSYPRLKGLRPPSDDKKMRQVSWSYSGMGSRSLWPGFGNEVGYYGYDTPAQLRNLGTDTQFLLVLSDSHGLYVGYHDQGQKQVVQICTYLSPAYVDSFNSSDIDSSGKVGDSAIGIDPNHLCFVEPGGSQRSEALVFEPFAGDWHAGAEIYKNWRGTWLKAPNMPAWVRDVHSWQQIQINSSEDRLEFPYKDLVKYAEACKRWGVKAIQLTGWQIGGQDRDFPLHDTEPKLGTKQEFKDAIAASKEMGVEIVLFNKYAWADVTAPDYASQFRKFAVEDPYGDPYQFNGYNYDTPTQIAGINARHGVGMCQASPAWRKRALEEFRKSVELGASGILYDECFWHMSPYCFSKTHGHPFPGAVFSGDVPLIDGFRTIVDAEKFVFAGESPYDIELQTYNMSYFRIGRGFVPMGRYIDPFAPMSVAVTGWNDRQMINACLLYRFSMSYEPRDFHGELDEMPVSMSYGRAVDDLRRKYKEWLWDAEFRDTLGAQVTAKGELLSTYSVFRRKDGLRAVAFANMSDADAVVCEVALENAQAEGLKWVSPEQPDPKPWPGKLELAPGAVAVVLEG
ncbi:MAG: DUF6259 domain-containing protein [Terracidiphilus sp.]|jgi:hypothetical protein